MITTADRIRAARMELRDERAKLLALKGASRQWLAAIRHVTELIARK